MEEPIPPETAANVYERTVSAIEALKNFEPRTQAERRHRATELVRLERAKVNLAERVINEDAGRQVAEVIGNDYVKPTDAARMNGNGHAPTNQPNWAQLIAETQVLCERRIAAFEEERSGGISGEEIKALAAGLVPFINEVLAEAVAPLKARIDELEATQLTDGGTWKPDKVFKPNQLTTYRGAIWVCQEPNLNVRPGKSSTWRLMHKTTGGGRDDP